MNEVCIFFFFKQKTAYDMRISDWSSDVCSSDLSSRTLQPSPRRRGHAMKHVLLPLAAAALLLAACGRDDDSVMSPDPAPPVDQPTPDDTMPEPMPPPVDHTMPPPPTNAPHPPDTMQPPPVTTPSTEKRPTR